MGQENHIENLGQEGYCSLEKILQGSVRDNVWARSLAELENNVDFLILFRVV
jgi:hypothetical protein